MHQPPSVAFYHWKTSLSASPSDTAYLGSTGCERVYVKCLDIARDPASGAITPYALLDVTDTLLVANRQWVPCVFIANEVFSGISGKRIDWLAEKTLLSVGDVASRLPGGFRELQIDCDWTASTREPFFAYLQKLREQSEGRFSLSATIRLHQYKFPDRTGVPPADRGMLMAYNTGDIEHFSAPNSIYNPEEANKYWTGRVKKYPIPLDLALPLFSWTLLYRDSLLHKIVPVVLEHELSDRERYRLTDSLPDLRRYVVLRETFLEGHYLRPGDLLRVEEMTPELVRSIVEASAFFPDRWLAFYHLDSTTIKKFPPAQIQNLCASFGQDH